MRSLIIGAGGFVGGYLVRHLLDQGDTVIATTGGPAPGSVLDCEHFNLDITDPVAVTEAIQKVKPEAVYHLAGISFVPEAESNFDKALLVNVGGTANVARACQLLGTGVSLLFVSSAEVYGHVLPDELPVREGNTLRPANNYSLSKRMAELVVDRYARQGGIRASIARPFNHIGPGQDPRFVTSNFALQLARVAHGLTPPILEVGNLEARRDFSDVRDIVRAYRIIGTRHEGVFNLGAGASRSIQEILDTLISISGCKVEVRQDPQRMRGPEVKELYASNDKATSVCGWRPEISFKQSLQDIYRYWFEKVAAELPS